MRESKEASISSMEAARWFGMSRPTFYRFADKHGIRLVKTNAALMRQPRRYSLEDAQQIYRKIYHEEPPALADEGTD